MQFQRTYTLGGFQRNARATWLGITECLWRPCNRTVAVIDSCEIPAKHNYNNSAAADQRGIGAPVTNYGSNIIMQLYRSRDKSGGRGYPSFFIWPIRIIPPPPPPRARERDEACNKRTRKFLAAEAMLSLAVYRGGRWMAGGSLPILRSYVSLLFFLLVGRGGGVYLAVYMFRFIERSTLLFYLFVYLKKKWILFSYFFRCF